MLNVAGVWCQPHVIHVIYTHTLHICFPATGVVIWLPQCQWDNLKYNWNWKIANHNKAWRTWIILGIQPANGRQCYNVTLSPVDWAHRKKDPWANTHLVHSSFKVLQPSASLYSILQCSTIITLQLSPICQQQTSNSSSIWLKYGFWGIFHIWSMFSGSHCICCTQYHITLHHVITKPASIYLGSIIRKKKSIWYHW